jgi:hypothetical protein
LCVEFAERAEQRESELGHPAPNCPTAVEIWRAVEIVNEILTTKTMTAEQAAYLEKDLAGIADKWLDPCSDPIGEQLHPVLEHVIDALNQELERAFPERAEMFRERASLRKLKQTMRRTIYLRNLNASWLNQVWAKLSSRRPKT